MLDLISEMIPVDFQTPQVSIPGFFIDINQQETMKIFNTSAHRTGIKGSPESSWGIIIKLKSVGNRSLLIWRSSEVFNWHKWFSKKWTSESELIIQNFVEINHCFAAFPTINYLLELAKTPRHLQPRRILLRKTFRKIIPSNFNFCY